jgi:hypothetical protein
MPGNPFHDLHGSLNPGDVMWINSRFRIASGWVATHSLCVTLVFAGTPSEKTPPWAETLLNELKLMPARAQLDPNKWTGSGHVKGSHFFFCISRKTVSAFGTRRGV